MGALKLLHRISVVTFDLDLWPILYILLQNATPSPFITRFRFRLLYMIALGDCFKTSTQNFDLWALFLICIVHWLQNATPSPFLTGFQFYLVHVIALGEGFKTSTQNFVPWPLWPLTLNLDLYGIFCLKNATPSPFLTWFWFHLLSVMALDKGLKTLLLLVLLFKWNTCI